MLLKKSIVYPYQKLIAEVYTISLFIPNIMHPMIIPNGQAGVGKTRILELIGLIVDPHGSNNDTFLKELPKEEKDRRVSIYSDYLSYFDNETHISVEVMDNFCRWVTGYSWTGRSLWTDNKPISYSGMRPIGITGINIPISKSDVLDRAFPLDMKKPLEITPKPEIIENIKQLLPMISIIILYLFSIISICYYTPRQECQLC
ncbi:MAG: hypothetical protein WAM14_00155 [Candidatus Nitrosopolaris sp.]